MYDLIKRILNDSDTNFLSEIILKKNSQNTNFIDLCIELINTGGNFNNNSKNINNTNINNIINILVKIYNLYEPDSEKKLFIITKLCKSIINDKKLLSILQKFNIQNIDIYSDEYYNTCVDYLIEFNEHICKFQPVSMGIQRNASHFQGDTPRN